MAIMPAKKVLVVGDRGQLGSELLRELQDFRVYSGSDYSLDITKKESCDSVLDAVNPAVLVNCAAYTAVDLAESERDMAFAINASGPEILAHWCASNECFMIHISTDYVFDGGKPVPNCYVEEDAASPLTVYGASKLEGEMRVARSPGLRYAILRTAWLYGSSRGNFLAKLVDLYRRGRKEKIKVVNDQFGSPTSLKSMARQIDQIVQHPVEGLYHASANGYCTWYEFARASFLQLGLPDIFAPCSSDEYPAKAARPKNSILCNNALDVLGRNAFSSWQEELSLFIDRNRNGLLSGAGC